jgi:hypothetical protein
VVAAGVVSSGGRGASDRLQTSLAWRDNGNGNQVVWRMNGGTVEFSPYPHYMQDLQFRGAGDFTGDGHEDVLLQRPAGEVIIWELVRGTYIRMRSSGPAPMGATFQAVGDFNGDRIADVLWRDATGKPEIWFEGRPGSDTDAIPLPPAFPVYWNGATPSFEWQTVGTGDFDGDGRSDIIWRHLNGQVAIWFMSGGILIGDTYPGLPSTQPIFQRVADFDGNGRSDILWRYASGKLVLWPDGDASRAASPAYQNNEWHVTDPAWQVQAASDFNFDGRADILWRHSNGQLAIWYMAGRTFLGDTLAGTVPATMTLNGVLRGAQ